MKFKILLISIAALASLGLFAMPQKAHALTCGVIPKDICDKILNNKNPIASPTDTFKPLLDFIINIMVGIFGSVLVIVLIISGVQMAASAGNPDTIKKARENIFKAVTGLVLLLGFRAILEVINSVFKDVDTSILFVGNSLADKGIPRLLGNITSLSLFFAGVVSVVFIIIGGIRYTTSAGSPEGLKGAKRTITFAIIGLLIAISSYSILLFIQGQLLKK